MGALQGLVLLILTVSAAVTSTQTVQAASERNGIEDRILSAVEFVIGQLVSSGGAGFSHTEGSERMYSADAGMVILALSAYQETHFTDRFYQYVKQAVQFLEASQDSSGDFFEYYDLPAKNWVDGGSLHYWDPFVILAAAYAANVITAQLPGERAYWAGVINRIRVCIDYWVPERQLSDGSLVFTFNGFSRVDVAATAAMLVGLVYTALFEKLWGDSSLAAKYANWSNSIAIWLNSLQERNQTRWGHGGFYTDASHAIQSAFENGIAIWGLDSYYKAASLFTVSRAQIEGLRSTMILWEEQFLEKTLDAWGGPQLARTGMGMIEYPKTIIAAASLLQAAVDVWINIGPPRYWYDAQRLYRWITGSNELSIDLQGLIAGNGRAFFEGIKSSQLINSTDLWSSSITLYAIIRAGYVLISGQYPVPEFVDLRPEFLISVLMLALLVLVRIRPRRHDSR